MLPALIASDVDGTLLDPSERVTDRTRQAVQAAVADGVTFVLATGDSVTSGNQARGTSSAANISSDQRRRPTSNMDVPDESDTSLKNAPVRR